MCHGFNMLSSIIFSSAIHGLYLVIVLAQIDYIEGGILYYLFVVIVSNRRFSQLTLANNFITSVSSSLSPIFKLIIFFHRLFVSTWKPSFVSPIFYNLRYLRLSHYILTKYSNPLFLILLLLKSIDFINFHLLLSKVFIPPLVMRLLPHQNVLINLN